ncbi:hypothetical protein PybrP1_008709 [[Pythium] brassicae (nom. inval.)]|nr:hypothetical protein PybrP1_008709 [[Pythium] brassicae (nom. inval.)]
MRRQDVVLAPARDQTARALREARRTGVLSLPARNLSAFPREVYHLEEHMDKDEKKWECVDLVKIDVSHNSIPELADDIGGLATVTSFKLAQNGLQTLPDGFFQLTALIYLDLSHNQLQRDLSEHIGALVNLKELGLAANKLIALPQSLGNLVSLEVLRVEENALASLPDRIGELKRLHTLSAHSNQLTRLPPSFASLANMQTLDLKRNRLESTSASLSRLLKLKFLDLRQNRLVAFPVLPESAALDQVFLGYNALASINEDSVLRVKDSITVLDMRDNKLSILPATVACLHRLKTLDVSNNDLADLPPGLGYLKHLNHIVVDGNPLRAIRRSVLSAGCESLKKYLRTRGAPPPGVDALEEEVDELQLHRERLARKAGSTTSPSRASGELDHLFRGAAASGTLDFSAKGVHEVPSELVGAGSYNFASTLLHLNLSKNGLTHLPAAIGTLSALVSLTVEENSLKSVDPSIATLRHLQLLRARKNQLSSDAVNACLGGHPAIGASLKELDLRNNALAQVPTGLRRLRAMETLLLSFNRIESLDGFPWGELASASVVSISDNRLRSLGTIYLAPRLASLSFENNNLAQVPCELGLCPHLRAVYVNGNPQKTVRGALIVKGSAEILAYLKNKCPPNAVLPLPPRSLSPPSSPPSALVASRPATTAVSTREATTPVPSRGSGNDDDVRATLARLAGEIAALELELEAVALSAPKRFALKKEVARLRSARLREERKLLQHG